MMTCSSGEARVPVTSRQMNTLDELVNCAEGALLESSEVAGTSGPPSRRFLGEETMSNLLRYARSVLLVIGLGLGTLTAQVVTFSDETFSDADWTAQKVEDTTPGASAVFTAAQVSSGGSGADNGPFRRVTHQYTQGLIGVAHLRAGAVYDPAGQGSIASIGYSYDAIHLNPPPGLAVGYSLVLLQNGMYYRSLPQDNVFNGTWSLFGQAGLTASEFFNVGSGPREPDFSATASPIQFGYITRNSTRGFSTVFRESGIDNWSVTIAPEGAPTCRIQPRNTYLPTHVFENHLSNPARHLPHPASVVVNVDGAPPSESVTISLLATKPAFLDSSETPTLSTVTLQTDANGRATFEHVPPSAEPLDRTDFEASGSIDGTSFLCRGSVVSGLGALTAMLRGAHLPRSLAPLRGSWNELLARQAPHRDPADLSPDETVQILLDDPELFQRLLENVKTYSPLLQAIAIARVVRLHGGGVNKIADVIEHFQAYAGSALQSTLQQVRDYLADRELLANFVAPPEKRSRKRPTSEGQQVRAKYDQVPLTFEANRGQADMTVDYLARGLGYRLYLTPQEALLVTTPVSKVTAPSTSVVRMQLVGALASPRVAGLEAQPGKSHYLFGNDPAKWRTNVPHYRKVKYEEVYPGVDLVYYGKQRQLAYDFIISPGASPNQIRLTFQGVDKLGLDEHGNLLLESRAEQFHFKRPFIYQVVDGDRQQIAGRYRVSEGDLVGFQVDSYDTSRPLVIDPVLSYSSYVGGGDYDAGGSIAVGPDGSQYVTGSTTSSPN